MLLPNQPPAVDGIHYQESNIQAFINQKPMGSGTLYVAESHISWAKDDGEGGFSLQYPHIAVHAVTHDTTFFAHPCIYLALDVCLDSGPEQNGSQGSEEDDDDDDDVDEDSKGSEVRFVPPSHRTLENIYKALNECQILHPDPSDDLSEEEPEEEEGEYEVIENGRNNGQHYFNENYEGAMEDGNQ